jgi:hypothetical protein
MKIKTLTANKFINPTQISAGRIGTGGCLRGLLQRYPNIIKI